MKKSIGRNFSQKFKLTHPPLPHASWSHVTCRIVKRLKYRVLSKKWTENKAKIVFISVFFTISDQNVTNFDQCWTVLNQRKTALNSSETVLLQRRTALKQHWTGLIISKSVRSKVSWRNSWEKFKFCQNGIRSKFPESVKSKLSRKNLGKKTKI